MTERHHASPAPSRARSRAANTLKRRVARRVEPANFPIGNFLFAFNNLLSRNIGVAEIPRVLTALRYLDAGESGDAPDGISVAVRRSILITEDRVF